MEGSDLFLLTDAGPVVVKNILKCQVSKERATRGADKRSSWELDQYWCYTNSLHTQLKLEGAISVQSVAETWLIPTGEFR
jgi:hypothetical protein